MAGIGWKPDVLIRERGFDVPPVKAWRNARKRFTDTQGNG
jgi:hypothetical protein